MMRSPSGARLERKASKVARADRKSERREQRLAEKLQRLARGERGAPVDWSLSTSLIGKNP
jgi:hypothetical protein